MKASGIDLQFCDGCETLESSLSQTGEAAVPDIATFPCRGYRTIGGAEMNRELAIIINYEADAQPRRTQSSNAQTFDRTRW